MADLLDFPVNYLGYPYVMALLYRMFGVSTYWHVLVNPLVMSLAVLCFYSFFKRVFSFTKSENRLLVACLIFSANLMYFSGLNLKDSFLLFLVGLCFEIMARSFFGKYKVRICFLLLPPLLLLMFFFRVQYAVLMVVFLLMFIFFTTKKKRGGFNKKHLLFWFCLPVVTFVVLGEFEVEFITHFFSPEFVSMQFERFSKWNLFKSVSPIQLMGALPFLPLVFLLPLPILADIPSSSGSMAYTTEVFKVPIDIELSVVYIVVLLGGFRWFVYYRKKETFRKPQIKIFFCILLMVIISLLVTNYITYERHRLLLTVLTLPLFVKSIRYFNQRTLYILATFLLVVMTFSYTVVRLYGRGLL
ncbi:hypothetical protein [Fulvitalea axinellae]